MTLVAYDPSWPARFREERNRLEEAELPGFVAAEHIGSTAVPGLSAKPIIDIALAVDVPARSPRLIHALETLGYRYLGTFGLRGRHFFRKGEPATVHLHVVHQKSPHWRAWLGFRDTLLQEPEWVQRYEHEKHELAQRFQTDRGAYTAAKGPIVARVLAAGRRNQRSAS